MTVLQLISSEGYYGAESMLVALGKALAGAGCRSIAGAFLDRRAPHTEVTDFARARGLEVQHVSCEGRWDPGTVKRIRRLIEELEVDVLHTHGYKADLYGYAATRGGRAAFVSTCHNWANRRGAMRAYAFLNRMVLKRADRVATPSPVVEKILLRSGVRREKLVFVQNGVDLELFASARAAAGWPASAGGPVIGFVGRLVPNKGGAVLIQAATQVVTAYPGAQFVFVGDGPSRADWEMQARGAGLERNVIFTGSRKDMPEVYASFDILALPSLDEAMPMCLLEAMAARRAVVATRVGGVAELVLPEKTGILLEPGDAPALEQALLGLLKDPEYAARLAEAGYQHVAQGFSSAAMARQYIRLYEAALAERCPAGAMEGSRV